MKTLPEDVAALLVEEREEPALPAHTVEQLLGSTRARLLAGGVAMATVAAVAHAPTAGALAAPTATAGATAAAKAGLLAGLGGAKLVVAIVGATAVAVVGALAGTALVRADRAAERAPVAAPAAAPVAAPPAAVSEPGPSELAALDDARRALRAGDAAAALTLVGRARAQGWVALREEMDVVEVLALAQDDLAAARAAQARFVAAYPDSIFRGAVDTAVSAAGAQPQGAASDAAAGPAMR